MKVRAVDFVVYPVSDLARAAAFYRDVLGLPQECFSDEQQWAEFDCGNTTLALHGNAKPLGAAHSPCIALGIDDVENARAELEKHGARIVAEPIDYGVCQAIEILDPDGNTVILHHRADGTAGQTSA